MLRRSLKAMESGKPFGLVTLTITTISHLVKCASNKVFVIDKAFMKTYDMAKNIGRATLATENRVGSLSPSKLTTGRPAGRPKYFSIAYRQILEKPSI
jgi:hypothetical protein